MALAEKQFFKARKLPLVPICAPLRLKPTLSTQTTSEMKTYSLKVIALFASIGLGTA